MKKSTLALFTLLVAGTAQAHSSWKAPFASADTATVRYNRAVYLALVNEIEATLDQPNLGPDQRNAQVLGKLADLETRVNRQKGLFLVALAQVGLSPSSAIEEAKIAMEAKDLRTVRGLLDRAREEITAF